MVGEYGLRSTKQFDVASKNWCSFQIKNVTKNVVMYSSPLSIKVKVFFPWIVKTFDGVVKGNTWIFKKIFN